MLTTEGQPGGPTRLVGFDNVSEVFLSQDRVLRGIYAGSGDRYREVLRICEAHDLFRFGIVNTKLADKNPFPEIAYDLILEHEKIPFISYPHEWSAQMLKDAALFHINLFQVLGQYGLTIKDWHPYNILFKNTEPVFIDFTSIIFSDALPNEEYLKPPGLELRSWLLRLLWDINSQYFYQMYQRMFVPYFLLPLYLMQQGRYKYARMRMLESTLNASRTKTISSMEPLRYAIPRPWRWRPDITFYITRSLSKNLALLERGTAKTKFLEILKREVSDLHPSLKGSAYSAYYDCKKEDFGFEPSPNWTSKNRGVYESIRRFKPKTLLDVGCNIGWFSILASKMGCQVVAFDEDEACLDSLYIRAKQEHLDILPLVFNFTTPTGDVYPTTSENKKSPNLKESDGPLLLAIDKRLKCDMVLALAIIHHLVLGQGQSFTQVVQSLNSLSNKYLILEFVTLNDDRITEEPEFLPAFNSHPDRFEWYTQENLLTELKHYYTTIEVKESFPKPRTLLICSK